MVCVETTTQIERDPASGGKLAPYLPRLVHEWSTDAQGARFRVLEGSLVSVDISGFTALAERLSAKGRAGAEELVQRISSVFDLLIEEAERHGGDVLKFRGDARFRARGSRVRRRDRAQCRHSGCGRVELAW